ncbi:MAG: Pr6Pr family membrane protein [Agriterribacter sp.]
MADTINKRQLVVIAGALLAWAAVLLQLFLILQNRTVSVTETLLRFFTFFTILSNLLVAICFTVTAMRSRYPGAFFARPVVQSAVTVYIIIVGVVYNLVLRFLWAPQGLQRLVDELLHSVMPVYFFVYWLVYVPKASLSWKNIFPWLIFPACYLVVVLVRGAYTNYYPYPFLEVNVLGYPKVFVSAAFIMAAFILFSGLLIWIGRKQKRMADL